MIRTLLMLAFWLLLVPFAALIGFPWTFLSGKVDVLYWLGTRVAFAGVRVAGVKVKVVGLASQNLHGIFAVLNGAPKQLKAIAGVMLLTLKIKLRLLLAPPGKIRQG